MYNLSQPLSHAPHFPALSIQTLITGDAMEGPLTVSAHLSTEIAPKSCVALAVKKC